MPFKIQRRDVTIRDLDGESDLNDLFTLQLSNERVVIHDKKGKVIQAPRTVTTRTGTTYTLPRANRVLGQGSFGAALRYENPNDRTDQAALKISVSRPPSTDRDVYLTEVAVNELVSAVALSECPGIAELYGTSVQRVGGEYYFYSLMKLYDGDLRNLNFVRRPRLANILRQLLETLICMGELGYVYNDLKSDNVLYQRVHNRYEVVLGDMGCVNCIGDPSRCGVANNRGPNERSIDEEDSIGIALLTLELWTSGDIEYRALQNIINERHTGDKWTMRIPLDRLADNIKTTQAYRRNTADGEIVLQFVLAALSRKTPRELLALPMFSEG